MMLQRHAEAKRQKYHYRVDFITNGRRNYGYVASISRRGAEAWVRKSFLGASIIRKTA